MGLLGRLSHLLSLDDLFDVLFKTLATFVFYFLLDSVILTIHLANISNGSTSEILQDPAYFLINLIAVSSLIFIVSFAFGPSFTGPVTGPSLTFTAVFLGNMSISKGLASFTHFKGFVF